MSQKIYPSQLAPRANIRLSDEVLQHLRLAAVMNRRSLNSEVALRLEQSIAAEKKGAAEGATSPRHELAAPHEGNSNDYSEK